MHLLFLHSSLGAGGAERTISTLARAWSDKGHSVTIVTRGSGGAHFELAEEIEHVHVDDPGPTGMFSRLRRALVRQNKVQDALKVQNPDVVLTFTVTALASALLARLCGVGGWRLVHSERSNPYVSLHRSFWKLIKRPLSRFADGIVFQTEGARAYYPRSVWKSSAVITNPVIVGGAAEAGASGMPRPYVATVGRLIESKAVDVAIKAFAQFSTKYPSYSLVIVGNGPERERLALLALEYGVPDKVDFTGVLSDAGSVLAGASMYVQCSEHEGMPNALMEAMATGLPCIAADCDFGPRALIQDGWNGWLIPVGDIGGFAKAMTRVVRDPDSARAMGDRARELRFSSSPERVADRYLRFIERIERASA